VKPARSSVSRKDLCCASVSGSSGGRTLRHAASPVRSATMHLKAGRNGCMNVISMNFAMRVLVSALASRDRSAFTRCGYALATPQIVPAPPAAIRRGRSGSWPITTVS
jgi:hypothetical protein